jgi:hypothetical protein
MERAEEMLQGFSFVSELLLIRMCGMCTFWVVISLSPREVVWSRLAFVFLAPVARMVLSPLLDRVVFCSFLSFFSVCIPML